VTRRKAYLEIIDEMPKGVRMVFTLDTAYSYLEKGICHKANALIVMQQTFPDKSSQIHVYDAAFPETIIHHGFTTAGKFFADNWYEIENRMGHKYSKALALAQRRKP
jgi:hypothetical protein